MNIKPKVGRLASGAYSEESPIKGSPFPTESTGDFSGAVEGGILMNRDRTKTNFRHPFANQFPVAKSQDISPVTNAGFRPSSEPLIQPHERNVHKSERLASFVTRSGAAGDKQADTPFNPNPKRVIPETLPKPATIGEKTNAASFGSFNNLWNDPNNSFLLGQVNVSTGRIGKGRWLVEKKGVV
jgi:hypothetical protein